MWPSYYGSSDESEDCYECDVVEHVVQCRGVTQRGTRCQITSDSIYSSNSRFSDAAQPLADGEEYCAFHSDQQFHENSDSECIISADEDVEEEDEESDESDGDEDDVQLVGQIGADDAINAKFEEATRTGEIISLIDSDSEEENEDRDEDERGGGGSDGGGGGGGDNATKKKRPEAKKKPVAKTRRLTKKKQRTAKTLAKCVARGRKKVPTKKKPGTMKPAMKKSSKKKSASAKKSPKPAARGKRIASEIAPTELPPRRSTRACIRNRGAACQSDDHAIAKALAM